MVRVSKKKDLRPSIMDRLIDNDPNNNSDSDCGQHQKLKELRQSVRRDLENLFNTRIRLLEPEEIYSEIKLSILNYGLPDLATVNLSNIERRREFVQEMERLLLEFEPRFKSVNVVYLENSDTSERMLRFRIDGTLYADPSPEVVVFDSVLEPVSCNVSVEETGHA
ncbi:MAG: type VI secretion system baseplate subunit TssE [Gammaproteobacteria bacterium]|nr:type VI secretion system baseplate subunit TssE [Gammaproteobacteria bacterium]